VTSAKTVRIYMDTSALVKLVVAEDESQSLRSFLHDRAEDSLFSAALARTELVRAVAPNGTQAIADARNLLSGLDTVMLTRQLLDDAGTLQPLRLRSLDAIHLVAAQRAGDALRAVVTYDARMLSAAADLGIATASPR
jgi:predicted nucleic acid-binding protein